MTRVAVFSAGGRIGQAQVRALRREGYPLHAVSRHPTLFERPEFEGVAVEVEAADYYDTASLKRILDKVDAAFFTPPGLAPPDEMRVQAEHLREALAASGLKRLVMNSTQWVPDGPPCGAHTYDDMRAIEDIAGVDRCAATVIFWPVLYMENLLTVFFKPPIVEEGVYRYCHRPGHSPIGSAWMMSAATW